MLLHSSRLKIKSDSERLPSTLFTSSSAELMHITSISIFSWSYVCAHNHSCAMCVHNCLCVCMCDGVYVMVCMYDGNDDDDVCEREKEKYGVCACDSVCVCDGVYVYLMVSA